MTTRQSISLAINDVLTRFTGWATYYISNLIVTASVLIIFVVINRLLLPKIAKVVSNSKLTEEARKKTYHTARLITGVITIAVRLLV